MPTNKRMNLFDSSKSKELRKNDTYNLNKEYSAEAEYKPYVIGIGGSAAHQVCRSTGGKEVSILLSYGFKHIMTKEAGSALTYFIAGVLLKISQETRKEIRDGHEE